MYDHELFVETTASFSERLLTSYAIEDVLGDLADRLTRLLHLAGCGVSLGTNGTVQAITVVPPALTRLEQYQQTHQEGPA